MPQSTRPLLSPLAGASIAAGLLAVAAAAQAAPLAPEVDRELVFLTVDHICGTGLDTVTLRPCEATNGAALDTAAYLSPLGAAASGHLAAHVDGFDGRLLTASTNNAVGAGLVTAIQFDDLTVTGPTPTVQVGVKLTLQGTTAASNARPVRGNLGFVAGRRAPSPSPGWTTFTDRIDSVTRIQILDTTASPGQGVTKPSFLAQTNGSFLAQVGVPFEYGFEFTLAGMNTAMDFSARVEYSLPAGYTLTSTRGLAVNVTPVPEPGTWALMLAGLAAVAGSARRRAAAG